jgi:phage tail-like protein
MGTQMPFLSFNFRVEIDGITVGAFREVTGLSGDSTVVEYRDGSDPIRSTRKGPGLQQFSNIILKRGYTTNKEFWNWYRNISNGIADKRNGSIFLQNDQHQDVLQWDFTGAWPKKVDGPGFNATTNEVAVETIELVHEGVTLV